MRGYKLTNQDGTTYGGTQWGPGVTHEAKPGDGELCTDKWIHFYIDPLIAVFMNPIQGGFENPLLWEIDADGDMKDDSGLKCGAKRVTTLHTIPLPTMTMGQCVAASIYIARAVMEAMSVTIPAWEAWGDGWLSGANRTESAAWSAAWSAESAAWSAASAAWSAAWSAANAARNAAWSAESAARSTANAAWSAARSAESAARSTARSAANAADLFPSILMLALCAAMDIE